MQFSQKTVHDEKKTMHHKEIGDVCEILLKTTQNYRFYTFLKWLHIRVRKSSLLHVHVWACWTVLFGSKGGEGGVVVPHNNTCALTLTENSTTTTMYVYVCVFRGALKGKGKGGGMNRTNSTIIWFHHCQIDPYSNKKWTPWHLFPPFVQSTLFYTKKTL